MSREFRRYAPLRVRFPRVSGDEPEPQDLSSGVYAFSPRERG